MTDIPVFDGHNDLLSCLWEDGDFSARGFFEGREGHIDLARARAGGLAGGFFAVWPPYDAKTAPDPKARERVFPPADVDVARRATLEQAAILARMSRDWPDAIRICTTTSDIRAARADGAIAAILHIEGCEGISADLTELYLYHAAGLRSLGPVWSRSNVFGHGVPFLHGTSPDTGPGLTEAGQRLVRECDRLGILCDLSHLNEQGFWDVARISARPLVATHSAAHAICPSTRNLTDRQLDAMAERGGLVGLNFGTGFLRPDGVKNPDTGLDVLIRHLDHLIGRLGEDGVALGSDFDGTTVPAALAGADRLPALIEAMRKADFGERLIRRIAWDNWEHLLERVIG
ncbi:membrane dipeptidase [Aliigemmobacter aestuarii]|uniref:Membrane dipeptidase n=1 Tax=Aliigemmobacter aestuarii TaxID=1445661 RepID=A0A4S3ML88_9RHOB|nr:dipeptidase [Gemmobacter aestuarii]THD82775.1 membrane dipeptidase [Gemmobacter aestuarii]